MQVFIERNDLAGAADAPAIAERVPGGRASLEAVAQLRQQNRETGAEGWMYDKGWKHVASVHGPLMAVAELLDPEFMKDKRKVYAFLDAHPEWLTYDRRKNARSNTHFRFDGSF